MRARTCIIYTKQGCRYCNSKNQLHIYTTLKTKHTNQQLTKYLKSMSINTSNGNKNINETHNPITTIAKIVDQDTL